MNRIYLDLHVIQSVPPSNINRDDTGSPKTAQYGGVSRARVSSQAWKKQIRDYFNDYEINENVGIRSLNVVEYVAKEIIKLDKDIPYEEAIIKANTAFNNAGIKTANNKVKALMLISSKQAQELAKAAIANIIDKKQLKAILKEDLSTDIALFGRMVADDPTINEDASAQVAHAISTHAVHSEFDFFTALDDLSPLDNAGAGMLGTVEFNASTLYRYANVNVHELKRQLKDDQSLLISVLQKFIKAFVLTMPTGKSNTFANQTLPQALLIVCRTDRPVNLVTAFETPIKNEDGYINSSIERLAAEYGNVQKFVGKPAFSLSIGFKDISEEAVDLGALLELFEKKISAELNS